MKETSINYNGDTYIVKSKYDYDLYEAKLNRDKEIERLNNIIKGLDNTIENLEEVVEHKDNIINELEKFMIDVKQFAYLDKLQELKGSDNNDRNNK